MSPAEIKKIVICCITDASTLSALTISIESNKKDSIQLIYKDQVNTKEKFEIRKNSIFKLGGNSGGGGGGGGDSVGIEFQSVLEEALLELKKITPDKYALISETKIAALANEMKVLVVDESLDAMVNTNIQNSVLLNFPDLSTIVINRSRWNSIQNYNIKKGLALHDFLSLLRLESTGSYPISAKYISLIGTDASLLTGSSPEAGLIKPRGIPIQTSTDIQEFSEKIEKNINAFCVQWIKSDKNKNSFLIHAIGNVIVDTDIYRSLVPIDSKARKLADQARYELDFLQLKFVKNELNKSSATYNELENLMTQFCK